MSAKFNVYYGLISVLNKPPIFKMAVFSKKCY